MKKSSVLVVLLLMICCLLTGCKKLTEEQVQMRDDLIGHWTSDAGDVYFTTEKMVVVTGGETFTFPYRVTHGSDGMIVLRFDEKMDGKKLKMHASNNEVSFTFSPDKKSLQFTSFSMMEDPTTSRITRVDDKQEP